LAFWPTIFDLLASAATEQCFDVLRQEALVFNGGGKIAAVVALTATWIVIGRCKGVAGCRLFFLH